MKAIGTFSANGLFLMTTAAFFILASFGSASAAGGPPAAQGAFEHCGCDNRKGIEMYVQNIINDSKQRGISCEMSMHVPACIVSYCSSCAGHPGLMENCIKMGTDYFASSCGQQPAANALFSYAAF